MAFDAIPESRQFEAIDWLADHGVQPQSSHMAGHRTAIEENLERLQALIDYAETA